MDRQNRALIARYKDGYREVAAALEGASDKELDAQPGAWQMERHGKSCITSPTAR